MNGPWGAIMINDPLFYVVIAATLLVLGILIVGVIGFARGGEFNRKHGNRIMRYRIMAQAVAIVLILAFIYLRRSGG